MQNAKRKTTKTAIQPPQNSKRADMLRKKYPFFIYESYSWIIENKNLEISFSFKILPDFSFKPRILIKNVSLADLKRIGERSLDNLVFNLGLIEMLSYWKATCSPKIIVEAGDLNKEQIRWWQDLMMRGMGQYFFENKINFRPRDFIKIIAGREEKKGQSQKPTIVDFCDCDFAERLKKRFLVPMGGGKDSIVVWETLKKAKKEINCFCLNPNRITKKVITLGGCKNPIIIRREIDKKLLELNQHGFLNGHVPFSAELAFLSVLAGVFFDYKYIAISNERSSNEGNVKYLGREINHQYSKSFDFENKFRAYSKKYLTKNIEYFSLLRPLYELQIAKIFSRYLKYFPVFMSCNQPFKTKPKVFGWCGQCAKCLFVFASLYPFLGEKEMVKVFGKNLFENKKLSPLMEELAGERGFKPFECVGTKEESLAAFYLSWKAFRRQSSESLLPVLLDYFEKRIMPKYSKLEILSRKILNSWDNENNLSSELAKILRAKT